MVSSLKSRRGLFIRISLIMLPLILLAIGISRSAVSDEGDQFSWTRVSRGSLQETITVTGEIQPLKQVNIGTTILGEIKALNVKEGSVVRKGDLLAIIDFDRLQQEISRVEAGLDMATKEKEKSQANLRRIEDTYKCNTRLREDGLISREDFRQVKLNLDTSRLSYEAALAAVNQNRAMVAVAMKMRSDALIKAPMDGTVTALKAQLGETAIPGSSNLPGATMMVLSDLSELFVEAKLNENEVTRVRSGQPCEILVDALPGRVLHGSVREILSGEGSFPMERASQGTNHYRVRVLLEGPREAFTEILPKMGARVAILVYSNPQALRVPIQSVLERSRPVQPNRLFPEKKNVVLVPKGGVLSELEVELGHANSQFYEVNGGLREGDIVITGPIRRLKDARNGTLSGLKTKPDPDV